MSNTRVNGRPVVGPKGQKAKPVAVHKPVLVPLHWQEEVKASIDRDKKMSNSGSGGCSSGELVTWCHRTVPSRMKYGLAATQSGHRVAQQTCCPKNTSHPVPVSPDNVDAIRDQKDDHRCLERVSECVTV